jgi:hypothetical protein
MAPFVRHSPRSRRFTVQNTRPIDGFLLAHDTPSGDGSCRVPAAVIGSWASIGGTMNKAIALDVSKLLGFRLDGVATIGTKIGAKAGVKGS